MTILSIVCTKLLCTNAHLGRRVAAHHFKVYICGSRNGIAILDSDKTLICLRNALHFIGSPIRQKGRSFFLKTNHLFRYEIMEEMASCINDSQWKIGAFFTNSFANQKKFHSRKKKINFGLNQQPDCAVILNADRKSSVILEADRSQIPIASLVDSTIPWESHKRITYPIPANDPIQFVYLFRHSITKTVILERPRIQKMKVDRPRALRHFTLNTGKSAGIRPYSSTSSSSPKGKKKSTLFFFSLTMLMATSAILFFFNRYDVPGATELQKELASVLVGWVLCLFQSLYGIFVGGRCATLGGVDQEWTRSSAEETSTVGKPLLMESGDWDSLEPIGEIPPLSPGRGMVGPSEPTQAGLPASEPSQPSSSTQEAGRPASDSGPSPTFETVGDPRDPAPTYKRVPAPTYNYPPDLRSLTKMEEKRLNEVFEDNQMVEDQGIHPSRKIVLNLGEWSSHKKIRKEKKGMTRIVERSIAQHGKGKKKGNLFSFTKPMSQLLVSPSHVRKYVLLSLTGTGIRNLTPERIYEKIHEAFRCVICVVVAKATTRDAIHVGILNTSISKNVGKKEILKLFTECSKNNNCSVKFLKGVGSLCSFLIKEDPEPFVRGEYFSKAIVIKIAKDYKNHRRISSELLNEVSVKETEEDPVNHLIRNWNYCSKCKVPREKEKAVLFKKKKKTCCFHILCSN